MPLPRSSAPTYGDTALYDTTLAAYRRMQEAWQPDRLNVVILLTDGKNEDPSGLSKSALLEKLKQAADPKKPVTIATIAYGQDADVDTLKQISEATGGRSFVAADPKDLSRVFLTMLASSDFSST